MKWQFWKKASPQENTPIGKKTKRPRPRELPFFIGKHLVVDGRLEPDWVWSLRSVSRATDGAREKFDIRIFSPEQAADSGANIRAFEDLDTRPDLVLFNGWYEEGSMAFDLQKGPTAGDKVA